MKNSCVIAIFLDLDIYSLYFGGEGIHDDGVEGDYWFKRRIQKPRNHYLSTYSFVVNIFDD